MSLISIIIPSYNRFDTCILAIKSIKKQTYQNIEIIVVNDCSTEQSYYNHNWDVTIKHLEENSTNKFGYPCAAYVRNEGVKIAKGQYIAFLDDDDYWLPKKLQRQLHSLHKNNTDICCTEAYCGRGVYSREVEKRLMLGDYHLKYIRDKYRRNYIDVYPEIWDENFIKIHNCVITSSVLMKKSLINKYGMMDNLKNGKEDWDYWKRLSKENKFSFVKEPCLYYDLKHANGRNY